MLNLYEVDPKDITKAIRQQEKLIKKQVSDKESIDNDLTL